MPAPQFSAVFLRQTLHKDFQVGEDAFLPDTRKLQPILEVQQQVEQLKPDGQALRTAIAVAIGEDQMRVQQFQPLCRRRQWRSQCESRPRLYDPEGAVGGRARGDAQGQPLRARVGDLWQIFKACNALTQIVAYRLLLLFTHQGQAAEAIQILRTVQRQRIGQ